MCSVFPYVVETLIARLTSPNTDSLSRYGIIYKLNFPNLVFGSIGYMIEVNFPAINHSAKQQRPDHVTVDITLTPYWDSVLGRRQTLYKLLALIISSAVFIKILPQAKRRVEILNQPIRAETKKNLHCKSLKRVYKAACRGAAAG